MNGGIDLSSISRDQAEKVIAMINEIMSPAKPAPVYRTPRSCPKGTRPRLRQTFH